MHKRLRKLIFNYLPNIAKTGVLCAIPVMYRKFEISPTSCNIMLTNRCNLRCVMCGQWREKARRELSTEEWKRIIDDLRRNGFRNIHFTGGEPLLRADLVKLVDYANEKGMTVGMTTNGILLTNRLLDELMEAGLRSMALSMDAVGQDYDNIRGVAGSFQKLADAAKAVAKARARHGIDAYINFTLMRDNINKFREVKELADSMGLPVTICLLDKTSAIFNLKENRENFWIEDEAGFKGLGDVLEYARRELARKPGSLILNYPALDYISKYFRDPLQKNIPCVVSQDRIYVDPYGSVYGGCLSMGIFGNLMATRFGEIKKSAIYKKAKKNMFYKRCPGCSCGYLFNIRHVPSLIAKDAMAKISAVLGR
ncbi:MAG: radical SAM protein [Candidatus Omnitrophica bacterium]|nr:radical SAM protein [Candidatus Omnitrophota bacterium]MCM8790586.1 radical SAM protein [Candidatus Omnitrophota bacterium]